MYNLPMDRLKIEDISSLLKKRQPEASKRDFGRLCVLAGSYGMAGAAILCGKAALYSGVGLTTFLVPPELVPILQVAVPEATCRLRQQDSLQEEVCSFVVGPGLGNHPEDVPLIETIFQRTEGAVVVDADGLNDLVRYQKISALCNSTLGKVITPHEGEAARLLGVPRIVKRREAVLALAQMVEGVAVLKGHHTLIADAQGHIFENPTGNPGMATGGTGDVLAGLIGGLLAQGLSPLDAAKVGVYIHGLAGDLAAVQVGEISLTAGRVADTLPAAFCRLTGQRGTSNKEGRLFCG